MKQIIRIGFFVAISFALSYSSISQTPEPYFRRYTVDDGLASSEVFHVFQDSHGYIWFATNNGVSRYDGYRFENFDLETGLVDNTVFEIYEDYKNRIWFIPLTGKLAYFENGQVYDFPHNNKIKDHLPYSRGPIKCSFYVDSSDNIHLGIKQFGRIKVGFNGQYEKYGEIYTESEVVAEEIAAGKVIISNPLNAPNYDVIFLGRNQKFRFNPSQLYMERGYLPQNTFFIIAPDSTLIFSINQFLYKVRKGKIIDRKRVEPSIIWMSIDKSNNLWIAPLNGGIQCYNNLDFNKPPQLNLLKDYQITSLFQDRENSYWFTSLNDGVFYCPDINVLTYTKEIGLADDRVNSVIVNKNGVLLGFEMGFVDLISNDKIKHFKIEKDITKITNIYSIVGDSLSDEAWVCSNFYLYRIKKDEVIPFYSTPTYFGFFPRTIAKSKTGNYWVGTAKGLKLFDGKKVTYESNITQEFSGVIYSLVEDKKGTVWFSSSNGLWKYDKGVYNHLGSSIPLLSQISNSLLINEVDSNLWVGTNGSGIVVYGKDTIYQITEKDGLISNSIHKLFHATDGVWAATRQGLSKIMINGNIKNILNYTIADGLPTNEVTSVYVKGNTVYAGTGKGLSVFDQRKIKRLIAPKATILQFKVNNQVVDHNADPIILDYSQNNLNIEFLGLVFRNEGHVKYRYRMIGVDSSWIQTYSTSCLYSGLTHGKYTFQVEVLNSFGNWSYQPTQIKFNIKPPYWQRTWFLVAISLMFTLFLLLIYRLRVDSIRKRNEMLSNINLYKQQSLRQQMNPHFIFNTLNSIQLFILEKDSVSSHKYLTKFARLMRMTLDNSLHPTIPLRDEIDALKIYLELEALRLEGKFEFQIDITNPLVLEYSIPTLLIQPFVENAIWHGIMLKETQTGWVKIKLWDSGSFIQCTIEDNGVGREMANSIKQTKNKEHKSRGSQITQQRIDLLNSLYKEKFNIRYTDLYLNEGLASGTRVEISIPKVLDH